VSQGILLADDSASLRRAIRSSLTERNLHVCGEAEDGVDALERARELKPDLILLDLAMPRLNGLEAATILKRQMPNVRTVLYTMYSELVSATFPSKAVCFDAVVAKGDGMGKLADCIQRLLVTSSDPEPLH
jgi:DNA-binding NarL/FixJ family response regulator